MLKKRYLTLLLCSIFVLLFSAGFSVNTDGEDEGIYRKQTYNPTCGCRFEYVYEEGTDRLLSISKLFGQTNTRHGISYWMNGEGDTTGISYYNMDRIAPLHLSEKKGNRISSVSEGGNDVFVDQWRSGYTHISLQLNKDSVRIDYSFGDGQRIFSEYYDNGRRTARQIENQRRFDSVKTAYYSVTGEQLFQYSCTSCHTIGKDATGPDLRGVASRHSDAWLRKWIANPSRLIAEGDPEAVRLFEKWQRAQMTAFPYEPALMDKLVGYLKTL